MKALKRSASVTVLLVALLVGLVKPASAYDSTWSRTQASYYAWYGVYERYVLGGATYRDNNYWDSDEGADCSGYAAKVWAVDKYTYSMTFYHPYSTSNFYSGFAYEVFRDRSSPYFMDAWTYREANGGPGNHMGLFRTRNSDGTWTTYEAKGSSYGIIIGNRSVSTLINWNYKHSDRVSWG